MAPTFGVYFQYIAQKLHYKGLFKLKKKKKGIGKNWMTSKSDWLFFLFKHKKREINIVSQRSRVWLCSKKADENSSLRNKYHNIIVVKSGNTSNLMRHSKHQLNLCQVNHNVFDCIKNGRPWAKHSTAKQTNIILTITFHWWFNNGTQYLSTITF